VDDADAGIRPVPHRHILAVTASLPAAQDQSFNGGLMLMLRGIAGIPPGAILLTGNIVLMHILALHR
jgi:hypothetical protein